MAALWMHRACDVDRGMFSGKMALAVQARLLYLCGNLFLMILSVLYAFSVWETTQSLTMEVDLLSLGCTITAVLINIVVELVKPRLTSVRGVVVLDLVGSLLSLMLLLCVGVMGVVDAMEARNDLKENRSSPTRHLEKLLRYGAFALCLSFANLGMYVGLRSLMLPKDSDVHDHLNIFSNLAHCVIDFVSNFAVLGTSLWLQYGVRAGTWIQMRESKVWVDVFGSFAICACILVSICFLFRDIAHSITLVLQHSEDQDNGSVKADAKCDYGSTRLV